MATIKYPSHQITSPTYLQQDPTAYQKLTMSSLGTDQYSNPSGYAGLATSAIAMAKAINASDAQAAQTTFFAAVGGIAFGQIGSFIGGYIGSKIKRGSPKVPVPALGFGSGSKKRSPFLESLYLDIPAGDLQGRRGQESLRKNRQGVIDFGK